MNLTEIRPLAPTETEVLLDAARDLAAARQLDEVVEIVRDAARVVSGADGVTFVLREGDLVHYVDENAIAPLWKGNRFPVEACISGWAITHRQTVVIEDVFADGRIPHALYRPTFVRSLAMVPVGPTDPVAAIGAYWARSYRPDAGEVRALETLAGLAAVALTNVRLDAELRAAVRVRDEFIGVASHELRTPLSAVQVQLERALRALERGEDPASLRHALDRARANTRRLGKLAGDLLDVARVSRPAADPERATADLAAIVAAAVERVRDANPLAAIQVEAAACRGEWDATRLEQVIENLVANAVKFGPGAPVVVRAGPVDGGVEVSVADRGIGIAPEDQRRIFDAFERAAPSRNFGGLGLGLWIARRWVEAHGGTIAVESRPGAGSTFTIRLPA